MTNKIMIVRSLKEDAVQLEIAEEIMVEFKK